MSDGDGGVDVSGQGVGAGEVRQVERLELCVLRAEMVHGVAQGPVAACVSPHETVRILAEHERRASDSLVGFARWIGVAL